MVLELGTQGGSAAPVATPTPASGSEANNTQAHNNSGGSPGGTQGGQPVVPSAPAAPATPPTPPAMPSPQYATTDDVKKMEAYVKNLEYFIQTKLAGQGQPQQPTTPQGTGQPAPTETEEDLLTVGHAKKLMSDVVKNVMGEMQTEVATKRQWEDFYKTRESKILAEHDLTANPSEVMPRVHFYATYLIGQGVHPDVAYQQAVVGVTCPKGQGYNFSTVNGQRQAVNTQQQQLLPPAGQGQNPTGVNNTNPAQSNAGQTYNINGQQVVQAPTLPGSPETPGQLNQQQGTVSGLQRLKQAADTLLPDARKSDEGYRKWFAANQLYKAEARKAALAGKL